MERKHLEDILNKQIPENEWLDYKEKWHSNKAELLRDILSFVNTVHNKDCYLIFGINDKSLEITGVTSDENRKNTQQITDFLTHQKLSYTLPRVKIETFQFNDKEIDILTVFNTKNVPLFLKTKYNDSKISIGPGQIFTRTNDTNTPKSESAPDDLIEKLYKKRLHLDTTIYSKYRFLLHQTKDWTYLDWEQKILYNFDPNFHIIFVDDPDESTRWHEGDVYGWLVNTADIPNNWKIDQFRWVKCMYGNHQIFEIGPLLYFDRHRGLIIYPKYSRLGESHKDTAYNYLEKGSLEFIFWNLLVDTWNEAMNEDFYDSHYSTKSAFDNIVVYSNNDERIDVETQFSRNTKVSDVEAFFNESIEPSKEEIAKLEQKNPNYGRFSLLQINIAEAIRKHLSNK